MALKLMISKAEKSDELRPIAENAEYVKAREKLASFQLEIESLHRRINELNARWYRRQSAAPVDAIEVAETMLRGGENSDTRDEPVKIRDLQRRIDILKPAAFKAREKLDLIHGQLSFDAGKIVQARHRVALAQILEAARALVAASSAERAIRAELADNGYMPLEHVTPAPRLAAPLILGDESWHDSALSHFRRQLEELGIAP